MSSNLDRFREGQSVEVRPGVKGRLNKEKKTIELSTGQILNAANNKDLFPDNEEQLNLSRQRENIERGIKKSPFGEFGHQFSTQGLVGAGRNWLDYATLPDNEYKLKKQAEKEVSRNISKRSPYISGAATAASFVPDIALTRGMSALKAAPLLTAAHAGPRIATEPTEVAKESLISAGGGYVLDKAMGGINKITQRRQSVQSLPGQQQNVRNLNVAGQESINKANELQNQQYNLLKQNVHDTNAKNLKQYQDDLNIRQNKIIQDTNSYKQAESSRDAHIVNLKNQARVAKVQRDANADALENQYKAAKASAEAENKRIAEKLKMDTEQYHSDLKKLPELQKKAQEEYSQYVLRNAEHISKSFPKDSKILSNQFGTNSFIQDSINKSPLAGSREANQATRILKSIFPEGEILTSNEISSRYRALEGAIKRSTPEVQKILSEFKTHLGEKLPQILADNIAYSRVFPNLKNQIIKEVRSALNDVPLASSGLGSRSYVLKRAEDNLNQISRELTPEDFLNKFQNGTIREQILKTILKADDFRPILGVTGKKQIGTSLKQIQEAGLQINEPSLIKHEQFINKFSNKLDKILANAELKIIGVEADASKKLGRKVKETYGIAETVIPPTTPLPEPSVPIPTPPNPVPQIPAIQLPPPLTPPQSPPFPPKPNLMTNPNKPTPQSFIPQPEPNLTPPIGFSEKTGDFLEKDILGGQDLINNPFTKLAGLKYILGKGALPVEAGYLGLKGLTSPTAGGEVARMSFKQGGIQAIDSWAQKYPSYHDGILEDPQERRSLTKQIEDDSEIPLEQKALLQSKVNRGKPISQKL